MEEPGKFPKNNGKIAENFPFFFFREMEKFGKKPSYSLCYFESENGDISYFTLTNANVRLKKRLTMFSRKSNQL